MIFFVLSRSCSATAEPIRPAPTTAPCKLSFYGSPLNGMIFIHPA
jgi:hypothetical protein